MKNPSEAEWQSSTFTAAVMRLVLQNPLGGETATNRIKQIGFMGIIYQMRAVGLDTTVSEIMRASTLSRAAIFEVATPLIERGLLREEKVLNTMGRGRASRLYIPEHIFNNIDAASPFFRSNKG